MTTSLTGQIAVVTGGASGIGEEICRQYAEAGATVVIADRDRGRADTVAKELSGHAITLDVTSEDSVNEAVASVEGEVGPVDILVTSAGVTQPPLSPEQLPQATWDAVLDVDLRGTWLAAAAFGRNMAVRGHGSIVTIASIAGMRSMPLHAYTPAKAAVIALTVDLAAEWGRSGVRVNSVSPGYTLTPLLQEQIDNGDRDTTLLSGESALGRLVRTDEVARAVLFLSSDDASAITGVNLPVDAGWLVTPSWHTYGGIRDKR
jgi:NAD(P)-dependent dehydrogenase (short-subunit alcohol dehydrogenase family)